MEISNQPNKFLDFLINSLIFSNVDTTALQLLKISKTSAKVLVIIKVTIATRIFNITAIQKLVF